jgi:hypothetical protein
VSYGATSALNSNSVDRFRHYGAHQYRQSHPRQQEHQMHPQIQMNQMPVSTPVGQQTAYSPSYRHVADPPSANVVPQQYADLQWMMPHPVQGQADAMRSMIATQNLTSGSWSGSQYRRNPQQPVSAGQRVQPHIRMAQQQQQKNQNSKKQSHTRGPPSGIPNTISNLMTMPSHTPSMLSPQTFVSFDK